MYCHIDNEQVYDSSESINLVFLLPYGSQFGNLPNPQEIFSRNIILTIELRNFNQFRESNCRLYMLYMMYSYFKSFNFFQRAKHGQNFGHFPKNEKCL